MTRRIIGSVAVLALAALAAGTVARGAGQEDGAVETAVSAAAAGRGAPVVLELFTSQGCSSCPPADALLARLGAADAAGVALVPLAFHVDYWNRLGWRDPFSDARWTERQRRYAVAFGSTKVYTPQLVVNGRAECVGSHAARAAREIEIAARRASTVRVAIPQSLIDAEAGEWHITIEAQVLRATEAEHLDVMIALFENGLATDIARGENTGLTLQNDYVVRRLRRGVALSPTPGAPTVTSATVPLDHAWNSARLGIAVFAQDPVSMTIHGAAVARAPTQAGAQPSS